MKKIRPNLSKKLNILGFAAAFAVIGGIIALLITRAAVPLTVDSSVPAPANVKVFAGDRELTVTWDHVDRADVVGYYLQYKKKGASSWENTRQTIHNSTQLQPLNNGQEYEITVQSARGTYQSTPKGSVVNGDSNPNLFWARADGHVSPITAATTVSSTPTSARRDAQANRLTGFFDDFNEPANPFNELKWNQAAFCNTDSPAFGAMAFINPQFHSHNAVHCNFGGITSRPRAIFDTSVGVNGGPLSESNPAQIEFDQDMIYDGGRSAWYLDLIPLDSSRDSHVKDVNSHHDLFNQDDADPPNMMRLQATNNGLFYNWYDTNRVSNRLSIRNNGAAKDCWGDATNVEFRSCDMNNKTGNFSSGLARPATSLFHSAQNVRRQWVVQITPTRMRTYIDNVLVADAALPSAFAAKRKFVIHNTMFTYNTGKGFPSSINNEYGELNQAYKGREGIIPYLHFYHWDNFGFTGPAATTVVHNYVDGGSDGKTPNYLLNAGEQLASRRNRTTIINIPDDIGNPIGGKAKLYYTINGEWFEYKWQQGDHFVLNGKRYDTPNPVSNMVNPPPAIVNNGIGGIDALTVMHEIPIADLRKGDNTITFNMAGTGYHAMTSNLHLELEYAKGTEPAYTQPIDYFRSKGTGALFSKIVEPPMTNCDSYIYVEQDLGLPRQGGAANLEPAPCYFLSAVPGHAGHGGDSNPTPLPNPDTTNPTISLTAPANNTTLSGNSVTASANASDNVGVNRVEFYVGGMLRATDTSSPYSAALDFTSLQPGTYSVHAVAYDTSGRSTQTSGINVIKPGTADTTAPAVTLVSPANNYSVPQNTPTVTLTASVTDAVGVTRVEFYGGNSLAAVLDAPNGGANNYTLTFNPASVPAGSYQWRVEAYDAAGNHTTSSTRTIVVPQAPAPGGGGDPAPDPLPDPNPTPDKPGDVNGDGNVNIIDLSILLSHYNQNVTAGTNGDLNDDGRVNIIDLSVLLSNYGS